MKTIITLLLVCITYTGFGKSKQAYEKLCEVNKCWREQPDVQQLAYPVYDNRNEREWIRTHLSMVEQTLRARSTAHLSAQQQANRLNALAHLNQYWREGNFPINDQYNYRTPIFIDKYDNFCAVGYLVKATGYEQVSRKIAAQTNLAYVREMNYPELFSWAGEYGFTVDELAWIQPGYPPETYLQNIGKGTDGNVYELYADNTNGILYVGGSFQHVDSTIGANNIAFVTEDNGKYTWHSMAGGVNGPVYAITVYNNKVYVGGRFTIAGNDSVQNLAYWDGKAWHSVGCIDGTIKDMEVVIGKLVIIGEFDLCNLSYGKANIAFWDGYDWSAPFDTLVGHINTIYGDEYMAYCGGKFSYNGEQLNIISLDKYGGIHKTGSIQNEVNAMIKHNSELYAVTTGDVDSTKLVMKFDGSGTHWGALYQHAFRGVVKPALKCILVRGNELLVAGDIQYRGQIQPGPEASGCGMIYQNQVYCYDGIWVDSQVNKMTMFKGKLIAAGDFNQGYNGRWSYGPLNSIGSWSGNTDITILTSQNGIINIFPNPIKSGGELAVGNNMNATHFRLYNISGRVVIESGIGTDDKIKLPDIPAGNYIVELSNINGEKAVNKLLIE